jgi:uncharacterized membrane protein
VGAPAATGSSGTGRSTTAAASATVGAGAEGGAGFAQVKSVIDRRCVPCHNAAVAQKNVRVDTPDAIARHAQQIYQQVVLMRLMPLGNATQMTEPERALIGRWFTEGAKGPSGD